VLIGTRTVIAERPVAEPLAGETSVRVGPVVGRTASFQRLADENLEPSYRLARVILGNRTDAEDAVHDAFVTAWKRWGSLRDSQRFVPWFQRILVNTCRDRLRTNSRRREQDIDRAPPAMAPDAYGVVDELDRMSRAFARLEADHRIVLALRYYHDLAVDDIAGILGVRPGTVKSRVHRAQSRMREVLATEGSSR
jgi:RNA polymerase sigma-70 factor (ECF subfamily)